MLYINLFDMKLNYMQESIAFNLNFIKILSKAF